MSDGSMNVIGYMYIYLYHLVTVSQQLELFLLKTRTDNTEIRSEKLTKSSTECATTATMDSHHD